MYYLNNKKLFLKNLYNKNELKIYIFNFNIVNYQNNSYLVVALINNF